MNGGSGRGNVLPIGAACYESRTGAGGWERLGDAISQRKEVGLHPTGAHREAEEARESKGGETRSVRKLFR